MYIRRVGRFNNNNNNWLCIRLIHKLISTYTIKSSSEVVTYVSVALVVVCVFFVYGCVCMLCVFIQCVCSVGLGVIRMCCVMWWVVLVYDDLYCRILCVCMFHSIVSFNSMVVLTFIWPSLGVLTFFLEMKLSFLIFDMKSWNEGWHG